MDIILFARQKPRGESMAKLDKNFLKNLLDTVVPSGYEQEIVKLWIDKAKEITSNVYVDSVGSAHAVINPDAPYKIVVTGHCDEIGLVVGSISDKGFLRVGNIGGWDPQVIVGQHVIINTKHGKLRGVIGKKPIHRIEDRKVASKIKELYVDIGAKDKKDAEKMIEIGDVMVLDQGFTELANNCFACRACDNKVGTFVALEVLKELADKKLPVCVEAIAATQEEIGSRGAIAAAYLSNANICFVVDTAPTDDTPDETKDVDLSIRSGVAIGRGPHVNSKLFELLKETAETNKISYQIEAAGNAFGTDTQWFQLSRGGMISSLLSVPCRYLHSPSETCSFDDIQATIDLLVKTISKIDQYTDFSFI